MIFTLAKRHMRVFFRDKMAVFFSLLASLILFVLYTLFLGNLEETGLKEAIPVASSTEIHNFVISWMFAGIVMITTLTTGLSALSVFVADRASDRFKDFMVSPLSKTQLILGYLIAAFGVSAVITTVIFIFSQIYMQFLGGGALPIQNMLEAYGFSLALCAMFSALSSFVITFIKSSSAFMSLGTIVGTLSGFLAGAFIAIGNLPSGVVTFLNWLPFNPAATLMRQPFTEQSMTALAHSQTKAFDFLQDYYGTVITLAGHKTHPLVLLAIFGVIFIVFVALGAWSLGRKIN